MARRRLKQLIDGKVEAILREELTKHPIPLKISHEICWAWSVGVKGDKRVEGYGIYLNGYTPGGNPVAESEVIENISNRICNEIRCIARVLVVITDN